MNKKLFYTLVLIGNHFFAKAAFIDIALGTKNRHEYFKKVIYNLNSLSNALSISLFIADGNLDNKVNEFIKSKKWNFKSINIYKDNHIAGIANKGNRWSIIYNFLLKKGSSPFVTFWSDDIFLPDANALEKAIKRLDQATLVVGTSLLSWKIHDKNYRITINQTGLPAIYWGVIRRKALEDVQFFDENYLFYCADNDLMNKLYFQKGYLAILNFDCPVVHNRGKWCNQYSKQYHYDHDSLYLKSKWERYYLKERKLKQDSIFKIYPTNCRKENLVTYSNFISWEKV